MLARYALQCVEIWYNSVNPVRMCLHGTKFGVGAWVDIWHDPVGTIAASLKILLLTPPG